MNSFNGIVTHFLNGFKSAKVDVYAIQQKRNDRNKHYGRIGIDLAKNVFQVNGIDYRGMPAIEEVT